MVVDNVFYFCATEGSLEKSGEYNREMRSFNVLHFITQPEPSSIIGYGTDDFVLTAAAEGHGDVTYQWQKDGEDIEGATTSTLAFTSLTFDDSGVYTCIANDVFYGDYASDPATLEVVEIITITQQPAAFTAICEWNPAVVLSILADNPSTGTIDYQWYKDGEIIYGANESTFTILNNPFNSGTYTCTLSGEFAIAYSEEAVVVISETTKISGHPASRENIEEGTDVTFLVIASGENLQYQWRKNGVKLSNGENIEGVNLPIMIIHDVTAADEGEYDCVVLGECLVLGSQIATLTVQDSEADGTSTSLDELAKQGISVFPNPSSGRFSIQFKEVTNEVVINIYDLTGKAVYSNAAKADYFDVDISDQSNGIYFLRMEFDNRIINSKIILK